MIRAWSVAGDQLRERRPEEAVQAAVAGTEITWIDLDCTDPAEAQNLLAPLQIHPLALEDMIMQVNRPKVDDYGRYLYVAVHSARWERDGRPSLREIDILVSERFIITFHDGSTRSVTAAHEVLPRRPDLLRRGPAVLLHFILDVMVDNYLPIMDSISQDIDELEEGVFRGATPRVHARILRLKRGMAALRRIVGPQRDTLLALTRDEFHAIPAEIRPYLRDVYDRLARVNDLLDSFRDETAALLELYVSVVSNRLNTVIKTLTVIATIMLPLTVITSYYGMNFKLAAYEWPWPLAEIFVLGLLGLSAGITWWWLRRNRWF